MLNEYPINYKGETVGTASVEQKGLYISIHCVCRMKKAGLYRVRLRSGTFVQDLGTCLQTDRKYEIHTQIPVKKVPEGEISFYIGEKEDKDEIFYSLEPGKPFPYISKLPFTRLERKDGCVGVIYQPSGPQDNDQIP